MLSFIAKAAFAGLVTAAVATIAKRSPGWGGLLAALPLTSILALVLLWSDTGDSARVGDLSHSILAFVVPSLPFFVILPLAMRTMPFWAAMALAVAATLGLYAATFWALPRMGVRL